MPVIADIVFGAINPQSAELICKKTSQPKGYFQFEIIINVLVSSFRFI